MAGEATNHGGPPTTAGHRPRQATNHSSSHYGGFLKKTLSLIPLFIPFLCRHEQVSFIY